MVSRREIFVVIINRPLRDFTPEERAFNDEKGNWKKFSIDLRERSLLTVDEFIDKLFRDDIDHSPCRSVHGIGGDMYRYCQTCVEGLSGLGSPWQYYRLGRFTRDGQVVELPVDQTTPAPTNPSLLRNSSLGHRQTLFLYPLRSVNEELVHAVHKRFKPTVSREWKRSARDKMRAKNSYLSGSIIGRSKRNRRNRRRRDERL
ncbi:hypothetical protein BDB00DRAFT_878999 [Zychaea mexicana]|uniref:uncharacterized protein n=1 Tax=Zychaea mexicana TaxID=64656 RepID=UPI0022FE05A4|nr:uncharacterized protein BDB00DRAFT_878999 [Zychaea mexicana]KAI9484273.1 hypothetical protein BDB00DRAFT_878999 [Zychaea mexicana]